MTDFRRPDLDLWEEDAEDEDARPTLVGPRPTATNSNAAPLAGAGAPAAVAPAESARPTSSRAALEARRALTLQAAAAEARGQSPADTTLTDDVPPPFEDHDEEDTRPIPPNFPALLADSELSEPEPTLTDKLRQDDAIARLRAGQLPGFAERPSQQPEEPLRASEVDRLTVRPNDEWGAFVDGLAAELPEAPPPPPPRALAARSPHPTLRGLGAGTGEPLNKALVLSARSQAPSPAALPSPARIATLTGLPVPAAPPTSWPLLSAAPTPLPAPAPMSVAWPAVAPASPPAPSDTTPTPISVRPGAPLSGRPPLGLPARNPETERVYGARKAPAPAIPATPPPAPIVLATPAKAAPRAALALPKPIPQPVPQPSGFGDGLSSIAPASDVPHWGDGHERPKAGITWLQLATAAVVMGVVSLFVGTYGRQVSRTGSLFARETPSRAAAAAPRVAPPAAPTTQAMAAATQPSPPAPEVAPAALVAPQRTSPAQTADAPAVGVAPAAAVKAPVVTPAAPAVAAKASPTRTWLPRKAAPATDSKRDVSEESAASASEPTSAPEPSSPAPAATAKRADLPGQPAREAIVDTMNSILPALQSCAGELHGNAVLQLTVRSEGFVSYALIGGDFSGTKEGSCIAQAVRRAKFPEFSDPVLRLTYPVRL